MLTPFLDLNISKYGQAHIETHHYENDNNKGPATVKSDVCEVRFELNLSSRSVFGHEEILNKCIGGCFNLTLLRLN